MTMYCKDCGAYIPEESDKCLACGKPRRMQFNSDKPYLVYNGENIPVIVIQADKFAVAESVPGRYENGEMSRTQVSYYRRFVLLETGAKIVNLN